MSDLTIYRASAGSGKTYKLTEEYLKLLFEKPYHKLYKHILATTFTNKAAEEMKTRILKEINLLAKAEKSDHLEMLKKKFGYNEEKIKEIANLLLNQILHDYSNFSISTIDKFFQKIIRSFAKDMKMQAGFEIELNSNEILEKASDNLLQNLDENKDLQKWLFAFVKTKIRNGKSWNLRTDIKELAQEIFKESFLSLNNEKIKIFSNKNFLKKYQKTLEKIISDFEENQKKIGIKAVEIIKNNNLDFSDFKGGKNSFVNYFKKIQEKKLLDKDKLLSKTILATVDDIEKWFTKKSSKINEIKQAYHQGLNSLLNDSLDLFEKPFELYNSAKQISKYFDILGILTDIVKAVQDYTEEKNIFPIAYSSKLLNEIIKDDETPFIYEKIGNNFHHFMIDEFQDTSNLQWKNFYPLLNNSLAFGNKNLVVGDVKQSIYRWRNSDWNLLASQINKDFVNQNLKDETLQYNWRSKKNVINFNNAIFHQASQILEQQFKNETEEFSEYSKQISNAYSGLFQHSPSQKNNEGGYIKMSFFEYNKKEEYDEIVKEELPILVKNLLEKNFQKKDICILVRGKKDGQKVANFLLAHQIDVISNDSLFLRNASVVRFLIGLLNYFNNSSDKINNTFLIYEYKCFLSENKEFIDLHELFKNEHQIEDFIKKYRLDELKALPIFELIERFIHIFSLNKLSHEIPYLQAFQDLVLNFSQKKSLDIYSFLLWWQEHGQDKTIKVSEGQDAVRIMTIHKSKGLEFQAVVMPYCDWKIDHNPTFTNILWCEPKDELSGLPIVPVNYGKKLKESYFKENYFKEKLQTYVDNLNLLYVAFTRAEKTLFAFLPLKKVKTKSNNIKTIPDLLRISFEKEISSEKYISLKSNFDNENNILEIGNLENVKIEKKTDDSNIKKIDEYFTYFSQERLQLRKSSQHFFKEIDENTTKKIDEGNLMHQIFEQIKTLDDINFAVQTKVFEGKILKKEAIILEKNILNLIKKQNVEDWFSENWEVKNEKSILEKGKRIKQADRILLRGKNAIVIDYKFGKKEEKSYTYQVRNYMWLLIKMGYRNVKGYLWYFNLDKITEVNLKEKFRNVL